MKILILALLIPAIINQSLVLNTDSVPTSDSLKAINDSDFLLAINY